MKNASIEKILELKPHPNADRLELAKVLGWQIVVQKGAFKQGELAVFVVKDSVVPNVPQFEFLKDKNFRVKTIRLRGEFSEGLCVPISEFPILELENIKEGHDVSEVLNISHWEKPIPAQLRGVVKCTRPSFIPKTDELNLLSYPDALEELRQQDCYLTLKYDGSSCSVYFKDGQFGVCSRNLELEKDENNAFWIPVIRYNLEEKLRKLNKNICIQGELHGPGIQKNPMGIKEIDFAVFDVLDLDTKKYLDYHDARKISLDLGLKYVSLFAALGTGRSYTLDGLQNYTNAVVYPENQKPAEGLVIRPQKETYSEVLKGRLSVKIINQNYKD